MLRFSDSEDENSGIVIAKRPRFARTPPAQHQRNTRMRRSNSITEKKNVNPVVIETNIGCSDDELKNEQSISSESVNDCFVIEFSESSTTDSIKGEFHYTSNMIHQIETHNFKHLIHSNYQIDTSNPNYSSQPCLGSFFLVREKRFHLRSMRKYVLQTSEKILMSAKDHGFLNPDIYINEGDDVHIKAKEYKYKITPGETKNDFLVYEHNESVGSLRFSSDYDGTKGPRKINLKFGNLELHSKIPIKSKNGIWRLPFNGHFTILSCRNVIMLDSEEQKVLSIRKISSNVLQIDISKPLPLYVVMALSVSNYIYIE